MRIGITTSVGQRGRSGVGQYLLNLVRAMVAHAPQHTFKLFVLEEDVSLFQFAGNAMEIIPVDEKYRAPVRDILWHQTTLPKIAARHHLDVVHTPSYRRLAGSAPCARVGTIHDLAPFRLAGKYDWKRMLYGRLVVKHLARRQDAIIAVSQNTANDVANFLNVAPERIRTIHNGIEHDRFHPRSEFASDSVVLRKLGITSPFILFVSRLEHPAKNHIRLIAAYEAFRNASGSCEKLVLGGSDWHGAQEIKDRAAASPFAADIIFPGFVPDADLPALYRNASVMVYPSLFEGFGLPPVEAMACGCPVICSARGALGEVVGDAAEIIDPESVGSIADALERVAGKNEYRSRLITAGLARASHFSWETAANETLRVYETAIARRSEVAGTGRRKASEVHA